MEYLFTGQDERVYPDIMIGPAVLIAKPGEIVVFDEKPPGDGLWVPYAPPEPVKEKPAKPASKES